MIGFRPGDRHLIPELLPIGRAPRSHVARYYVEMAFVVRFCHIILEVSKCSVDLSVTIGFLGDNESPALTLAADQVERSVVTAADTKRSRYGQEIGVAGRLANRHLIDVAINIFVFAGRRGEVGGVGLFDLHTLAREAG